MDAKRLQDLLQKALGDSAEVRLMGDSSGLISEILSGKVHGSEDSARRPATVHEVTHLLARPKFQAGDILTLAPHAADYFKWPLAGERVIVTQALETPYRDGDSGTPQPAQRNDIAIAIMDGTRVMECLHDSRNFVKIGHVEA